MTERIMVAGIDLGTTNSTISVIQYENGDFKMQTLCLPQPTNSGEVYSPLIPSVVATIDNETVVVGEGAKRLMAFASEFSLVPEKNLFFNTKNEMGLKKVYFRADENLNRPYKIGGTILSFIKTQAEKILGKNIDKFCVTVPASFQLNQRRDTLLACKYADIPMEEDDLLEEPTAALIDYFIHNDSEFIDTITETPIKCVVFDFGGGTCDVAVVEISKDDTGQLKISELSISRYHRLGGSDIDKAIVYEILLPELFKENGLDPLDLTWAEKKKGLEPQLLPVAEALKIGISRQIEKSKKLKIYNKEKQQIRVSQPSLICRLPKRSFKLSNPSISAEEFENILKPFLDTDLIYLSMNDYRITQSIFSPINDALTKAYIDKDDIDFCLLVGGSSLIPQVQESLKKFFKKAQIGFYSDADDIQLAVSRGAAYNAFFKAITKKPLIQPVLHEGISIITDDGSKYTLIPPRSTIPYP
ncbi:Hsp70 family protein [Hippea jasoniae]|uniref:Hsp70 family protein n=1 Tax=Hippea jasoniae TaxID=944479 RepID=UPI0018DB9BFF|nr:Hsp70 family protein [Hippea jasoniae]